jgi:hypothetical protein
MSDQRLSLLANIESAEREIQKLTQERDDAETAAGVLASENRQLRKDLETAWNSATFHAKRSRGRDRERLDWLDSQYGCALVNDDDGMWAVAGDGVQNIREGGPLETTFYIEPDQFRNSTREAIDAAMMEENGDE